VEPVTPADVDGTALTELVTPEEVVSDVLAQELRSAAWIPKTARVDHERARARNRWLPIMRGSFSLSRTTRGTNSKDTTAERIAGFQRHKRCEPDDLLLTVSTRVERAQSSALGPVLEAGALSHVQG
jgi:hypothetical protein